MKRRRLMCSKWLRNDTLYIGTWNVMTMLKVGRMNEIADEMLKTQLQVIALEELRWKEQDKLTNQLIHSIIAVTQRKLDI